MRNAVRQTGASYGALFPFPAASAAFLGLSATMIAASTHLALRLWIWTEARAALIA